MSSFLYICVLQTSRILTESDWLYYLKFGYENDEGIWNCYMIDNRLVYGNMDLLKKGLLIKSCYPLFNIYNFRTDVYSINLMYIKVCLLTFLWTATAWKFTFILFVFMYQIQDVRRKEEAAARGDLHFLILYLKFALKIIVCKFFWSLAWGQDVISVCALIPFNSGGMVILQGSIDVSEFDALI